VKVKILLQPAWNMNQGKGGSLKSGANYQ